MKKIIKRLFAQPSIELAKLWPIHLTVLVMKKLNEIQLSARQMTVISKSIKEKAPPCKLLIFGLGNDSVFWSKLNQGGVTIFLEDNRDWHQRITKRTKGLAAFLVCYHTKRSDWKMLLESPSLLDMILPNDVEKEEWDVILVDAPKSGNNQTPGRMKSIFHSGRLVKSSGDIFVHDCNREVEDIYCDIFLNNENLKLEIKSPKGILRYYHMTNCFT